MQRNCPVCDVVYSANDTRLKWGRETTCSRQCSYVMRAAKFNKTTTLRCALCSKECERSPARIKRKDGTVFCSRACHYAARAAGLSPRVVTNPYQYTDATIWKLRQTGAAAIARRGLGISKHEVEAQALLQSSGIPFVEQFVVEDEPFIAVADLYLPRNNTIIEIDGHEHTRHSDSDRKRDEVFTRLGFRVIRVRNRDTPQDTARAVLLAALR